LGDGAMIMILELKKVDIEDAAIIKEDIVEKKEIIKEGKDDSHKTRIKTSKKTNSTK
jgi:hypothetical protein